MLNVRDRQDNNKFLSAISSNQLVGAPDSLAQAPTYFFQTHNPGLVTILIVIILEKSISAIITDKGFFEPGPNLYSLPLTHRILMPLPLP